MKNDWRALTILVLAASMLAQLGCRTERPLPLPRRTEVPEPTIRVRVAGPAGSIPLAVSSPFVIRDPSGKTVARADRLSRIELSVEGNVLKIGSNRLAIKEYLDFVPEKNGTIRIDDRGYGGLLRFHRQDNRLLAVNYIKIEEYLKGVLPAELPRRFLPETFKAQAITARTFALYEKYSRRSKRLYDVAATEHSQVYHGRDVHISRAIKAVEQTRGVVLTHRTDRGPRIFPAYFSSTCGGWTQPGKNVAAGAPDCKPLAGNVRCSTCTISPRHRWSERRISAAELTRRLNDRRGLSFQQVSKITILEQTSYGRMVRVRLGDISGRSVDLPAQTFRLIVGSRKMLSAWCRVRKEGDGFVFYDGHGFGHGAGMCQWGAEGMARRGYTAGEILAHYYPTAELVPAY